MQMSQYSHTIYLWFFLFIARLLIYDIGNALQWICGVSGDRNNSCADSSSFCALHRNNHLLYTIAAITDRQAEALGKTPVTRSRIEQSSNRRNLSTSPTVKHLTCPDVAGNSNEIDGLSFPMWYVFIAI